VLGLKSDGIIGPLTLGAIGREKIEDLIEDYCDQRLRFLESLKGFAVFGKGWTRRVNAVEDFAKKNL